MQFLKDATAGVTVVCDHSEAGHVHLTGCSGKICVVFADERHCGDECA